MKEILVYNGGVCSLVRGNVHISSKVLVRGQILSPHQSCYVEVLMPGISECNYTGRQGF